jgi:uncharacterized RDD family membrane protein YckC
VLARLIDGLILTGAAAILEGLLAPFGWLAFVVIMWMTVAYFYLCEAIAGQTVGKNVMGLRVLRRDGAAPSAGSIATRNVIRVLEEPVLALITLFATRGRRQRLGDLAAGTTVGRAEGSKAPGPSRLRFTYPALWAVGGIVFLVSAPQPGHPATQHYPPAPSLAGDMSEEWSEFARSVDEACASNFNEGQQQIGLVYQAGEAEAWDERTVESRAWHAQAVAQRAMHSEIRELGPPPAEGRLFERWLANVEKRATLMERVSESRARDDTRAVTADVLRIDGLKIEANRLGQRFGLRICTSNGPGREPTSSGEIKPASPRSDYIRKINRICLRRNGREDRLAAQNRLDPNTIIDLQVGETINMMAIPPPADGFQLRRRILAIKQDLDRHARDYIHRVAASADPNRTLARLAPGLERHGARAMHDLQRLGLLDCGNWGPAPAPTVLAGAARVLKEGPTP